MLSCFLIDYVFLNVLKCSFQVSAMIFKCDTIAEVWRYMKQRELVDGLQYVVSCKTKTFGCSGMD